MLNAEGQKLIRDYCLRFIGTPYVFGGNNPIMGLDCSGFVCEVLRAFGIIGREDLSAQGIYDKICMTSSQSTDAGSIAFFGVNDRAITHVSVVVNSKLMVEAGGGDSLTTDVKKASDRNAFVRIRPILSRRDFITALMPYYTF